MLELGRAFQAFNKFFGHSDESMAELFKHRQEALKAYRESLKPVLGEVKVEGEVNLDLEQRAKHIRIVVTKTEPL